MLDKEDKTKFESRIGKIRKGKFSVQLIDSTNKPITGFRLRMFFRFLLLNMI